MREFNCPYCNYFLSKIDNKYHELHNELNYHYSILLYPFGEFTIKSMDELKTVSSFLLQSYFSIKHQERIYTTYNSILSLSSYHNLSLSNPEFHKIKLLKIQSEINKPFKFSDVFSELQFLISKVLCNNTPSFISHDDCTPQFQRFFYSIIQNPINQSDNSCLLYNTFVKSTDCSSLEQIFTLLFDVLIILNSVADYNEIKNISLKMDIQKTLNYLDNIKCCQDSYNNNVSPPKDMDTLTDEDIHNLNDQKIYRDFFKHGSIIRDNLNFISMNYLKCLLLVTYYYAEYKDLFL